MTDTDIGGNAPDSPTGDTVDQGASPTDDPGTGTGVDPTDPGQDPTADPQAADPTGGDTDKVDGDKPLPYDQDPKWKSARAAERRVTELLDKHNFDSIEDLASMLDQGHSIIDLLGERDAKAVVDDYDEFQKVKKFWAEQEAAKLEDSETPEETIQRLKKEKQDLIAGRKKEEADAEAQRESQRVMDEFDRGIKAAVNSNTVLEHDADKLMLIKLMGVDNEMALVDPYDKNQVQSIRDKISREFETYLKDRDQRVIKAYIEGKSDITPIGNADTGADVTTVSSEAQPFDKGMTVEQKGRALKDRLLESITKTQNV